MSTASVAGNMHASKQQEVLESFGVYLAKGAREISNNLQATLVELIDPNKPEQRSSLGVIRHNITNLTPVLSLHLAKWYRAQGNNSIAIEVLRKALNNTDGAESEVFMSLDELADLMDLQILHDEIMNAEKYKSAEKDKQ
ncbi:hypothetical protein F4810DRAFT_715487 [Camillea tinctor]|nr:hypothetical protein F4810DRAFT_715487 [Camillea tinctor]